MSETPESQRTRKICPHCKSLDIKKHRESNRETSDGKTRKTDTVSRCFRCVKCKKTFLTPATTEVTLRKQGAPRSLIESIDERHKKQGFKDANGAIA